MENMKYRVIFEYEFHRGTSAAETARRINDVYCMAAVSQKKNSYRPSQTTSELAAGCGVSDKTVIIHLKQIGKVKKLER
ncbi:unnamed protein product [Pieris macdunnoughi]|uniref:Mos1 transposase HTH domain-containing protein n=1 Tax=Pieris macdunnoughi TaxID=345717 RepID=A0A821XRP1_9NEOP|nr:unnamed protein product [Pieris macdunnoughi]